MQSATTQNELQSLRTFERGGRWFRGNIHMHSTRSDGQLPPEELVALYASRGYDFLALTDHRAVTRLSSGVDGHAGVRPVLIPAMEVDLFDRPTGRPWHLVGLGLQTLDSQPAEIATAQDMITALRRAGGVVVALHPYWLGLDASDLLAVEGLTAVEVYNHSHLWRHNGKGIASWVWDGVLDAGRRLWATAADDAHHYPGDAANAWIMVRAEECTGDALLASLAAGHFYASTGPTLHDVALTDGHVSVACSPVERVRFIADGWNGDAVSAADRSNSITEATYNVKGHERYVRVEVTDTNGCTAWSQPLFVR